MWGVYQWATIKLAIPKGLYLVSWHALGFNETAEDCDCGLRKGNEMFT